MLESDTLEVGRERKGIRGEEHTIDLRAVDVDDQTGVASDLQGDSVVALRGDGSGVSVVASGAGNGGEVAWSEGLPGSIGKRGLGPGGADLRSVDVLVGGVRLNGESD